MRPVTWGVRPAFNDAGRASKGNPAQGKERIVTTRQSAQIARHSAVVLASAASLSLTVAAGVYIINQMADQGKAVLVISSELPELLVICDRVYAMSAGRPRRR